VPTPRAEALVAYLLSLKDTYQFRRRNPTCRRRREAQPDDADHGSKQPLEQAGASDEQIQNVHAILLREKPEPTEGYSPLPLMLLGLMSALILFSAIYLGRYSGGFDPMVYDERILPGMLEGGAPVVQDPKVIGRRVFANCIACHQTTGLGLPGAYPPLAGSEWAQGPEDRIIRIVLMASASDHGQEHAVQQYDARLWTAVARRTDSGRPYLRPVGVG